MSEFLAALRDRVLLFDGAMGTMLMAAGLGEGEVPESMNLSRPDALVEIHLAYLESGADVVQTNTFGASRLKLPTGLGVVDVNERAAAAARSSLLASGARGRFVAGEIGPTGRFLPPVGDLEPKEARSAFREQAEVLSGSGVDLFIVETMVDLREAIEAVRAIREASDLPVVASLTFDRKPRGFFTLMGDTPDGGVSALLGEGADVVGANCSLGSKDMVGLAGELRAAVDAPLVIQPNAGQPEIEDGRAVYRQPAPDFARDVVRIVAAGANAVGGCCGTTPEFVRAIREVLS